MNRHSFSVIVFSASLLGCKTSQPPPSPSPSSSTSTASDAMAARVDDASVDATASADAARATGLAQGLPLASPHPKINRATAKKIARDVLADPHAVELIRIPWGDRDEQERAKTGGFFGYLIESRGFAKHPQSVGRSVDSFIEYKKEDPLAKKGSCFIPHHGIIAVSTAPRANGKDDASDAQPSERIELLICFMCSHVVIHVDGFDGEIEYSLRGGGESEREETTNPARAFGHVLDALYDQSGLPHAVQGRAGPRYP